MGNKYEEIAKHIPGLEDHSRLYMKSTQNTLVFLAQRDAHIFFDAAVPGAIQINTSRPVSIDTADSADRSPGHGAGSSFKDKGVYRVILKADKLDECDIEIRHSEGITPI